MSQKSKIINLLDDAQWHCTSEMYQMYMSDPRTIISKMRKDGYNLVSRWCQSHKHEGMQKQWKMIDTPKTVTCCTSFIIFSEHSRDCSTLKDKQLKIAF